MTARRIGKFEEPQTAGCDLDKAAMQFVASLQAGERLLQTWQEACERTIELPAAAAADLLAHPIRHEFVFPGQKQREPIVAEDGTISGVIIREQHTVRGTIDLSLTEVEEGLYRLTVRIANTTQLDAPLADSGAALLRSLVSTHTVLGLAGGEFVSLFDPPDCWRAAAADCQNIGAWPVLVGAAGERDTMLSSPIILYDYPQIAPESMGDLFDGTEIDEILTLRILTLTDDEKRAMGAIDERAKLLLQRTESAARDQLMQLHGTLRDIRPLAGGGDHG
jgi:hydrogenase maturation protease